MRTGVNFARVAVIAISFCLGCSSVETTGAPAKYNETTGAQAKYKYTITSKFNRYLQARSGPGHLHASEENVGEEETWYLYEIDASKHEYALQNYKSQLFLQKNSTISARTRMRQSLRPTVIL
jgi:hypothetical protein